MVNLYEWVKHKSFNLEVRLRQEFYKNSTNYPHLSGDSFASACEVSVYGANTVTKNEIVLANSIFCPSEKLEQLLQEYGDTMKAKVLVLGNTDRDFYALNCDFPPSIDRVYLQNSHISDGFFHTLPIGIENLRYGRNGLPSLFDNSKINSIKLNKILVGPFSPTHPEGKELESWEKIKDPRILFLKDAISPKKLAKIASGFKFIACPRGNGTDTHRFWETLYRGSIPVVKTSLWSKSIANLGLKFIQIRSWNYDEFCDATLDFDVINSDPQNSKILWMNYWEELFSSNLK